MQTELTELRKFKKQYETALTDQDFEEAEFFLVRFHKKYGSIEERVIKNLIR